MKKLTLLLMEVLLTTTIVSANNLPEKQTIKCLHEIAMPLQAAKNKIQNDDYKKYRAEQEKKIAANEKKIVELRSKKEKIKKENIFHYESKIDELEKKNEELKKRISSSHKVEDKQKWESFKKEYTHDMSELGESLQDLFKTNVE